MMRIALDLAALASMLFVEVQPFISGVCMMAFALLALCLSLIICTAVTDVADRLHHGGHSPSHVAAVWRLDAEVTPPPHVEPDTRGEQLIRREQVVTTPLPIPVSAVSGVPIEALRRIEVTSPTL
jgi:hypothetical protein